MRSRRTPKTPDERYAPYDPWADTHPHRRYDPQAEKRYHHIIRPHRSRQWKMGCAMVQIALLASVLLILAYFLVPNRTNMLLLGNDARPEEGDLGRSDTIILLSINPLGPTVSALSIPRDLWVEVPGQGLERINTAHFYGEMAEPGSGPAAAIETIRHNFGIEVDYYVRLRFDGFQQVVDALGGIDIDLPQDMSGYTAGRNHLNGEQALALVRDRTGSDDFFRMLRAQIFLKAVLEELLNPENLPELPDALLAMNQAIDTNVPVWQWPRLGVALLRAGSDGVESRTISREMTQPFTTEGGANVLGPIWEVIDPLSVEMFGASPPPR